MVNWVNQRVFSGIGTAFLKVAIKIKTKDPFFLGEINKNIPKTLACLLCCACLNGNFITGFSDAPKREKKKSKCSRHETNKTKSPTVCYFIIYPLSTTRLLSRTYYRQHELDTERERERGLFKFGCALFWNSEEMENKVDEVVAVELPAPPAWKKKVSLSLSLSLYLLPTQSLCLLLYVLGNKVPRNDFLML